MYGFLNDNTRNIDKESLGGWECGMGERCRADQLTRICSADKKCTNTAQCHLTVSRACRQLSRRGPGPRSDYNITIEASGGESHLRSTTSSLSVCHVRDTFVLAKVQQRLEGTLRTFN